MLQSIDSDKVLVVKCLSGDKNAFGELVNKYQLPMYNTVLNIIQDTDDAKDILQRSFIKAWENLDSYNADFRFFSWMYRIVLNETLNSARKKKSNPTELTDFLEQDTPHDKLVRKETVNRLAFAISKLNADSRAVILLRYFEDMSYAEMADVLEIDEKTVKSRLFSARLKLREALIK